MSTSILKLTNIDESSNKNGVLIFQNSGTQRKMKNIIELRITKETQLNFLMLMKLYIISTVNVWFLGG